MDISVYTTYDLPVPYKNIKINPVTMKDYGLFTVYSKCLTVEKNLIPDPKIISMTELEYLFHSSQSDAGETPYLIFFDRLLAMVLKEEESFDKIEESVKRYKTNEKGKPFFSIGDTLYDSADYEEIKNIIAEQNMLELPDESISPEVRKSLEEAREYKRKTSGQQSATLEEYVVALATVTGWQYDYIYSLTVRKFFKSIERLDTLIHYKIYLAASMSGMVEFKDKSFIKHWLTGLEEKDKFKDVSLDYDAIQKKMSFGEAKEQERGKYK